MGHLVSRIGPLRFWLLCLAAALFPTAADAQHNCEGKLVVQQRPPTLSLAWTGTIADPMGACIEAEFDKAAGAVRRVAFYLDSEGGYLPHMERAIAALTKIRKTHDLATVVSHGKRCWSACVPVFLAGKYRYGALTSTWLFHEVGKWTNQSGHRSYTVDRTMSDRIFQDYYLPAGVSEAWLKRLYLFIPHSDYWQTGQNLWEDKSGIITHPIDNLVPRGTERPKY
jgi:hypothetical protein